MPATYRKAPPPQARVWPATGRVDNVYGDRNLVCNCVGMEAYAATPGAAAS